ncbi:MAG: hypothetical protein ACI9E1_000165 [Cryomorphaceae bacterium]|jgi:hypothetical protein
MKSLIKSTLFTALASFIVLGQFSHAQEENKKNTDVTTSNKRFWEASLAGGEYMVALDRISAISKHSYIVNKSLVVHEVNVQTSGSGFVRFYSFEAVGENSESNLAKNLIERGKNLAETGGRRAGVDTNTTVEKEYPVTTHAHTIEYRLFDSGDLNQLYSSLKRAWRDNRGRKFSVK